MKQELDFIIIGAQKAGTTSLFEYLRRHPQVALPAHKEVPFFSHEAVYRRDWNEYLRKAFPFADPGQKWGTVTPHYMVGGIYDGATLPEPLHSDERTVPLRIHSRLPEVRLVAIIRDPVERARSHHAMALLNGWEHRDFATAVRELLEPAALEQARATPDETTGYVTWGEYGRILSGYFEVFGPDRVLVVYTTDLKDEPQRVVRRVFEFIGVDPDFVPENLGETYRQGGTTRRVKWLDMSKLQAALAGNGFVKGLWHRLPEPARRRVDTVFSGMNYRVGLWNRREALQAPSDDAEAEAALRAHYAGDADELRRLLDGLPPWAGPGREPSDDGSPQTRPPRQAR